MFHRLFAIAIVAVVLHTIPNYGICVVARLISSESQYVYTPGVCDGGYPCPGNSSTTEGLKGLFWVLGAGDPTLGAGIDSGSFPARFDYGPPDFLRGWLVNYAGYPGYIAGSWGGSQDIDGCPDELDGSGGAVCTAVLLSDQVDGQGYLGVYTDERDALQNYSFAQLEGSLTLAPVDRPNQGPGTPGGPVIAASQRIFQGVEVSVAPPAVDPASIKEDPACPSAIAGYRVYAQALPRGADAPVDRDPSSGWVDESGVLTMSEVSTFQISCTNDLDIYIATSIVFDSGFETGFVSSNSSKLECGPNAADVDEIRPRVRPGQPIELRNRAGKRAGGRR